MAFMVLTTNVKFMNVALAATFVTLFRPLLRMRYAVKKANAQRKLSLAQQLSPTPSLKVKESRDSVLGTSSESTSLSMQTMTSGAALL
jgi:hypothetical protein